MAWLRTKTLFNIARHLWSQTCSRLCKRETLNCLSSINKLKALNLFFSAARCQQEAIFMWRIKRNNKQKQFLWLKNWIEEIDEKTKTTSRANKENASETKHALRALVTIGNVIIFVCTRHHEKRSPIRGPLKLAAYLCAVSSKSVASFVKMTSRSKEQKLFTIPEKEENFPLEIDDFEWVTKKKFIDCE